MRASRKFIIGRNEEWRETRWREACDRASMLLGDPFEARAVAEEVFDGLAEFDDEDRDDAFLAACVDEGVVSGCLSATGCPASADFVYLVLGDADEEEVDGDNEEEDGDDDFLAAHTDAEWDECARETLDGAPGWQP